MKTTTEHPYRTMMSIAATLTRLPAEAPARHLRALATELSAAVRDLDARMRAGLTPPQPWQLDPQRPLASAERWGEWILPEQPAPGTVVTPARPTQRTRGRSWRRLASSESEPGAEWLPQHEPETNAQSWAAVLRQCGGAVRVTYPATVAVRVLTWRHSDAEHTNKHPT